MTSCESAFEDLWISRFSRYSGAAKLARALERPGSGPYLLVVFIVVLDLGVLSGIATIRTGRVYSLLENPFALFALPGLLFLVWATRKLVNQYSKIREEYNLELNITRNRLKYAILLGLFALHGTTFLVVRGVDIFFTRFGPVVGTIKLGLIYPLIYFPLIAEASSIMVFAFLMVPHDLVKNDVPMKFDDPLNIGGMEMVGELIKKSIYVYSIGMLILIGWLYGPFILSTYRISAPPPGMNVTGPFLLAWITGIVFFLYGVFKIHYHMQDRKRRRIEAIHDEICALGDDDFGLPETELHDQERSELEMKQMQMAKVRQMRTWPFTAAAQEQILFSTLFPIVIDRLINIVVF